jgi:hypothetical protein
VHDLFAKTASHFSGSCTSKRQLIAEIEAAHGVGDETVEGLQHGRQQFDGLPPAPDQANKTQPFRLLEKLADMGARYAEAAAEVGIGNPQRLGAALPAARCPSGSS